MTDNIYTKGNTVRFAGRFQNQVGAVFDPVTITFKLEDPNGTVSTYAYASGSSGIVRDGVGLYHFDWIVDLYGTWQYKFLGTDMNQTAGEGEIFVQGLVPATMCG